MLRGNGVLSWRAFLGRELGRFGHTVRLIAPALGCATADNALRSGQEREKQPSAVIFRTGGVLIRQRTQLINAIRGHLSEFGFVPPSSNSLRMSRITPHARRTPLAAALSLLVEALRRIEDQVKEARAKGGRYCPSLDGLFAGLVR